MSIATVKETAESSNRILALIITLGTVTKHQLASLVNSTPDQVDEILLPLVFTGVVKIGPYGVFEYTYIPEPSRIQSCLSPRNTGAKLLKPSLK